MEVVQQSKQYLIEQRDNLELENMNKQTHEICNRLLKQSGLPAYNFSGTAYPITFTGWKLLDRGLVGQWVDWRNTPRMVNLPNMSICDMRGEYSVGVERVMLGQMNEIEGLLVQGLNILLKSGKI